MRKTVFILLFTIAYMSSCTKEELPNPEVSAASIDLIIPTDLENIDTLKTGLYLEKKVMKGTKLSTLKGISSSTKSP